MTFAEVALRWWECVKRGDHVFALIVTDDGVQHDVCQHCGAKRGAPSILDLLAGGHTFEIKRSNSGDE